MFRVPWALGEVDGDRDFSSVFSAFSQAGRRILLGRMGANYGSWVSHGSEIYNVINNDHAEVPLKSVCHREVAREFHD